MLSNSRLCASICITVIISSLQCNAFVLQQRITLGVRARAGHHCHMSIPLALAAPVPELRGPKDLFANVVNIGATKAKLAPLKTLLLGIKSGCHISFGEIYDQHPLAHHSFRCLLPDSNCQPATS